MDDLKVYVKFSHKNKKINFVKCIFRLFIKSLNCEDYQNFEEFLILKKYVIIFIIQRIISFLKFNILIIIFRYLILNVIGNETSQ